MFKTKLIFNCSYFIVNICQVQVYWSFWYSCSLADSVMCDVMPGYACFVCVVMRLRLDKKLFILPFYVLRTYLYVVMPICCVMSHSTLQ